MSDITIPPAALVAAEEAFLEADRVPSNSFEDAIRAACLAMIEAWPGMYTRTDEPDRADTAIILPLPQEASDE